jgi:phosphatidylglycerol:prolipoprotein diacylglycerol transferase
MFPTILKIGPVGLHSYGLMLALAFIIGIAMVQRGAQRLGVPREAVADLGLWILVASVAGSRLYYVASHWEEYASRPLTALAVWDGGLTFYGGVLLALPVSFLFIRKKRLPGWSLADLTAPAFALGLGLGRIGCFLSGCCFGKPSHLPWAMTFPADSFAGSIYRCPIHPTQLYESLFGFLCFGLLSFLARRKYFPGFLMVLFLGLYGAWRFAIDNLRYYESSQLWLLGLTNNQWISILMVLAAIAAGIWLKRKSDRP